MDVITLWASKTALMAGIASPLARKAVTSGMTRWLYENRMPLPLSGVWMGRYLGRVQRSQAVTSWPRILHAPDPQRGMTHTMFDWTAILGHLVFKVVMLPETTWDAGGRIEFDEPKPLLPLHDGSTVLESFAWPPDAGFVEPEVVALSYALCGAGLRLDAPC
jgi:hypothetical protein